MRTERAQLRVEVREETMTEVTRAVWGLFVITAFHIAGVRGHTGDSLSLYHKVGEDVSLTCNNVVNPNCSATTWVYNGDGSQTIEEVGHGKIKEASQRPDRLSLGSDCSLTVRDVRVQDAGRYICRQFPKKGGPQQGKDAPVFLSVLTMSSSPPETDLEPDRPVTLSCSLSNYDGHAGCHPNLRPLSWVDEAGRDLQGDPRYQVTGSHCDITLTTTLKKEDNNRKFRCQLTNHEAGKVETFLDFLPSFPERPSVTLSPTSPGSQPPNSVLIPVVSGALGASLLLLCSLVVLIIVRNKRAQNKVLTRDNIALNTGNVTNATGNQTNPPTSTDSKDPDDVITYASINHSSQRQTPRDDRDDSVTYASVNSCSARGPQTEETADPSNLYATVNKHNRQ